MTYSTCYTGIKLSRFIKTTKNCQGRSVAVIRPECLLKANEGRPVATGLHSPLTRSSEPQTLKSTCIVFQYASHYYCISLRYFNCRAGVQSSNYFQNFLHRISLIMARNKFHENWVTWMLLQQS
jgi:hypothetical protein